MSDRPGTATLGTRQVRQVYLITYSRAQEELVPNRETFAELVLAAFPDSKPPFTGVLVLLKERHLDGGFHYHMAIKLQVARRWLQVRNILEYRHGMCELFR